MTNIRAHHIIEKVHPHVLPHPTNNWQAFLLKSPSLFLYIVFLITLTIVFNFISFIKPGILGYASNIKKEDIVAMTNQKRASSNLPTLSENPLLTQAAVGKAQNMFAENYWAHVAPSGKTPWDFIKSVGYGYNAAGENLARDFDQSESVVSAWMASSSHRENLLNASYQEIGVGVVNGVLDGRETTLVVQMLGTPKTKTALAKPPPQTQVSQTEPVQIEPTLSPLPTVALTPVPTSSQVGQTAPVTVSPTPSQNQITPTQTVSKAPPTSEVASVQSAPNKTLINSFQIVRSVSFSLLALLIVLLGADLFFASRRRLVRNTGHTIAHMGLLILLLIAIWYTNSGLIL